MNIRSIPITQINPAPYNPRVQLKPGDPEWDALGASIKEFGLVEPLIWNERTGNLVGGHQRLAWLKHRGDTHADASVVDLDDVAEKKLNIALNKIAGRWDDQKLAELLDSFNSAPDFDFLSTGFTRAEAQSLVSDVLGKGNDEAFDVDAEIDRETPPITQPGDLITLGVHDGLQHRLLCGDSTDPAHVRRLMDGQRAALFATDPPYLVGYDGSNHPSRHSWGESYGITWDDADAGSELYDKFIGAGLAEAARDNAAVYVWYASSRHSHLEATFRKHKLLPHCQIIWVKNKTVFGRSWYGWGHEPCLVGAQQDERPEWYPEQHIPALMGWKAGNKPSRITREHLSTVWELDVPAGKSRPDHPTPKPIEVFEIPIRQHTRPGEICFEPFSGSGTQFIAAQRSGRRCFGLEISPRYCDVIIRRFIAFAGEDAVSPDVAERYRVPQAPIVAGA